MVLKLKKPAIHFIYEGDGFSLRNFVPEDAVALASHANNSRIAANLRDVFPYPYHLKDAREFIEKVMIDPVDLILAIEVDGEACGAIGLNGMDDIYRYNAEIGYWLSEQHWNKGIAGRAVGEMVRLGFTHFHWERIWAGVFAYNTASARVLEKNGFNREALHRQAVCKNGKMLDEYIYALLKEEWKI